MKFKSKHKASFTKTETKKPTPQVKNWNLFYLKAGWNIFWCLILWVILIVVLKYVFSFEKLNEVFLYSSVIVFLLFGILKIFFYFRTQSFLAFELKKNKNKVWMSFTKKWPKIYNSFVKFDLLTYEDYLVYLQENKKSRRIQLLIIFSLAFVILITGIVLYFAI